MNPNKRMPELDILKGLGILFVILGHSVPDFPINLRADFASSTVESVLYGFHMPLFFLSAGFVLQVSNNQEWLSLGWFYKKGKRLLVPYFVFSFFSLTLRSFFSAFTRSSVDIGASVYGIFFEGKYFWFLYVMFGVLTTIEALRTLKISWGGQLLIALFFYCVGLYTESPFLCINRFGYYLIYTVLGMVVYHKKDVMRSLLGKCYIVLMMMCLFIAFYHLRLSDCLFVKELCRFGMAISGTVVTYSVSLFIVDKSERLSDLLSYFGKTSLQYYLVHMIIQLPIYYLVAKLSIHIPLLSVFMIFLITTLVSYLIVTVMCRIPICCFLLGMPSRKNDLICRWNKK